MNINIKILTVFLITLITIPAMNTCSQAPQTVALPINNHPTIDAYDGWHLAVQAWTFNRFTFYEAVDKAAAAGLDWIEAFPGQRLSPEKPDQQMHHAMSAELREEVKHKLVDAGVHVINYGVVALPNDEVECRKVFEFAKAMGIQTLQSEPPNDAFDLVDKLCQEYQINVAIHNHPNPTHYWSPDTVLKALKGRSHWLGSGCDTGHWMRSGINPIEAIRKLKGRIKAVHLKDLNEFGVKEAHDVIWGTGKADIPAILAELHAQGYKGAFSIEYEYNWDTSFPEVAACVQFFNATAAKLNPTGWSDLIAPDLSNCTLPANSWTWDNFELAWHGGGYIWTNEQYGNFVLDLEYKVSSGANSGVFFRTANINDFVNTGIEVQIHDSTDGTKYGMNGAIYDCLAPGKNMNRPAGVWNHYTITCKDNKIYVVLNNAQIIDMDVNKWTVAGKNPDGTDNKFKSAYKDMPRVGHIGLQDHGQPVWFRNVKIKKI
jgi:sugar phosphate isomerase/epimerase